MKHCRFRSVRLVKTNNNVNDCSSILLHCAGCVLANTRSHHDSRKDRYFFLHRTYICATINSHTPQNQDIIFGYMHYQHQRGCITCLHYMHSFLPVVVQLTLVAMSLVIILQGEISVGVCVLLHTCSASYICTLYLFLPVCVYV